MNRQTLGRFEILGKLGRGSMGSVYLAHDPKIGRRVAIKTLEGLDALPEEESQMTRARFLREAQAAGRLAHPNIVTIFDIGEEGSTPYIAMEYLEGRTLEDYTREPDLLPGPEVISLMVQACEALQYAHSQGIVHRDIKPANLMILPGGLLKIADFGLAKSPDTNLTTAGLLVGTPYYMAPEQIRGCALDGRSDLFSLGVVLYQMLNGSLPFPGESIHTVIHRIMTEPPQPGGWARPVPEALRRLVERSLAKDPEQRIASGEVFAAELRRIARAWGYPTETPAGAPRTTRLEPPTPATVLPVKAPPDGPGAPRAIEPIRQRRRISGIALLLAFFGMLGTLSFFVLRGAGFFQGAAALAVPAPAALPSELAETGPTIRILTDPAATLTLDGRPLNGPSFRLVKGDAGRHTVRAVLGCRSVEKVIDAATAPREISLAPAAAAVEMPVSSTPPGATVSVDGKALSGRTPLTLPLDGCTDHRVEVALAGYASLEYRFEAGADPAPLAAALGEVAFRKPEPATVRLGEGPYAAKLFIDGRLVGEAGGSYKAPSGRRRLALVNDALLVRLEQEVDLRPGESLAWSPEWPGLGNLTVQATPTNCGIHVRPASGSSFRYLDDVPVVRYRLASGGYTVRATLLSSGESQEKEIQVLPGSTVEIDFTFSQ